VSRLLMNLRHVPDDEADEVRALLKEHGIGFYETQAGRWRISLSGIWVEEPDYPAARTLLDDYQRARAERARAEREEARARGEEPGFIEHLRANPEAALVALGVIALMLALALWPWLLM